MGDLCLPKSTRDIIAKVGVMDRHPGLQLDKLSGEHPANEHQQKEALKRVCATLGFPGIYSDLLDRWKEKLAALRTTFFDCQTTGPLTLHLSRASALENAGICLHPIYGFVYLPGSGLKGMARAYAETVWKPAQTNTADAQDKIEEVFGNQPGEKKKEKQRAGSIVFHDAWPIAWPKLELDIVNNHHSKYYQGKNNGDAPGDWENPIPVNFLAIGARNTFTFALAKRRDDVDDDLVNHAREWLIGALCHMGAGAKTNAGYGSFKVVDEPKEATEKRLVELEKSRETYSATLELVTPAFLAGARQDGTDCDLRPATLRGLLRWWWRTMHAGYVDITTLRAMEAAIWGDTNTGGAVRIALEPKVKCDPISYNHKNRFEPEATFKRDHDLQGRPNNKTTQGLFYASYGMNDDRNRDPRHYMPAGAQWNLGITARGHNEAVDNNLVIGQAKAALWLLCRFGGVGSKSRKGFGSFADVEIDGISLDTIKEQARRFQAAFGVSVQRDTPESASLHHALEPLEIPTQWKDCWFVLDQLGFSYQSFAQQFKHENEKISLGLPRKIHGPKDREPMPGQQNWRAPIWLGELHPKKEKRKTKDMRDASPVHFHISKNADGTLTIRAIAFPAKYLPDFDSSKEFLQKFLDHLNKNIAQRANDFKDKGRRPCSEGEAISASATTISRKRDAGTPVKVKIIAARKKGGFDVQEEGKRQGTLTIGTAPSPPPNVGDTVDAEIVDDKPDKPMYKWPSQKKSTQPRPGGGKGKGNHRRGGGRR